MRMTSIYDLRIHRCCTHLKIHRKWVGNWYGGWQKGKSFRIFIWMNKIRPLNLLLFEIHSKYVPCALCTVQYTNGIVWNGVCMSCKPPTFLLSFTFRYISPYPNDYNLCTELITSEMWILCAFSFQFVAIALAIVLGSWCIIIFAPDYYVGLPIHIFLLLFISSFFCSFSSF